MLWFIAGWGRSWQTKGKTQWGIVQYMVNACIQQDCCLEIRLLTNFKSSDLNGIIKLFCLVILKNIETCLTCMYTGYSWERKEHQWTSELTWNIK